MNLGPWVIFGVLVATSFPLVLADQRDLEVPVVGLVVFWLAAAGAGFALEPETWVWHGAGVTVVIAVGTLVCLLLPGRLGEADILYASGLAWVCTFSGYLIAIALGCLGALVAMVLSALRTGGWHNHPQPFLPALLWGWTTVTLGQLFA